MLVYYNEVEPFMVDWLAKLMRDGAIPDGEIDTRSIEDVQPEDLKGFDQCHFFAGLGAWAYALELAQWPEHIPVWTGSCPCQGVSRAGKKRGFNDERHLWPAWKRLVGICQPPVLFGEQVSGEDGWAWLDRVSTDLENEGFAVGSLDIPAAVVGAPQERQRIYFVGERLADAPRFNVERERELEQQVAQRKKQVGGDGPRGGRDPYNPWETGEFVATREGWRRPVEPGVRLVAPRSPQHVAVLSGLGNSIVAPLAAEFVISFLESSRDAETMEDNLRNYGFDAVV
tara:strand:- start:11274 stop:12128 length:855 start_codon:yes stop_codon:yes gene_type:complete